MRGQRQPVRANGGVNVAGNVDRSTTGGDTIRAVSTADIAFVLIAHDVPNEKIFEKVARAHNFTFRVYPSTKSFLNDPENCELILLACAGESQSMPAIISRLRASAPRMQCVILSQNATVLDAVTAMRAGALDYMLWPESLAALYTKVRGWIAHIRQMRSLVVKQKVWRSLTKREREVAVLVGRGGTNREIAVALGISRRTVEIYRHAAMRKYDLKDPLDAVIIWSKL